MAWNLPPDRSGMGGVFGADGPLWLQSGTQEAPQLQPGAHLRNDMPMPKRVGIGESIANALLPRRDDQGNPQGPTLRDILSTALMAMPGQGRPVGVIPSKAPMFRANNYAEPPVAANAVPASEMTRLQTKLVNMMPITPANEAQALALRAQLRKLDDLRPTMHDSAFFGRETPQKPNPLTTDLDQMYGAPSASEKARLLGIRVVDPNTP